MKAKKAAEEESKNAKELVYQHNLQNYPKSIGYGSEKPFNKQLRARKQEQVKAAARELAWETKEAAQKVPAKAEATKTTQVKAGPARKAFLNQKARRR